ncbi:ATP-binding protein [Vreelandella venusta]|uniref:ATP-binding protein n=1 Tax=Vreelandella venusta TaxID=44935 RepID=UPI003F664E9C
MHIGLFGVSGSGKTFLSNFLSSVLRSFSCVSASSLLKDYGGVIDYEELKGENVSSNQEALVLAYELHKKNNINTLIELHGVIETPEGEFWVPKEILKRLSLDVCFYLKTKPDEIHKRRMLNGSKKRRLLAEKDIEVLQEKEIFYLKSVFVEGSFFVLEEGSFPELICGVVMNNKF